MIARSYTSEGIVLARKNFSEADRILSIYTKDYGRISLLAKGVRKPSSKKRGHIEVFTRIKFSSTKGRGFGLITEVATLESYPTIRKNLKRSSLAYYFTEAVGRTTHEGEVNRILFELLLDYLEKLKTERQLKKLRLNFIIELLTTLGFWPKGQKMDNPDQILENVVEREFSSVRVGKKVLQ